MLPPGRDLTLLLIGIAAAAVLLIIGIVSVAGILACRRQPTVVLRRRSRQANKPPDEVSEAGFGEGFLRRSAQYRASLYGQEEEERTASVRHVTGKEVVLSSQEVGGCKLFGVSELSVKWLKTCAGNFERFEI